MWGKMIGLFFSSGSCESLVEGWSWPVAGAAGPHPLLCGGSPGILPTSPYTTLFLCLLSFSCSCLQLTHATLGEDKMCMWC